MSAAETAGRSDQSRAASEATIGLEKDVPSAME